MFLALWPGARERRLLGELAAACAPQSGGKAVAVENVHLTLIFLGELQPSQVKVVASIAAGVPVMPFTLVLDRLGLWRRNGIVWAGCRHTPDALGRMVEALQTGLRYLGFRVDARPYRPHLTLVRKARRAPRLQLVPLEWRIEAFCLVRSDLSPSGANYEVVRRWSAAHGRLT